LIGSLAGGLLIAPLPGIAQQPTRIPRIGILGNTDGSAWDGFRSGLRDLGYVEGRDATLVWRWADGSTDRYPALASELVRMDVDLIVTSSTPATFAARQATRSIPILMLNSAYPDKIGLVESLARPGGNVTGFSNGGPDLAGKKFEMFKSIAPKISHVAVIWNPASPIEPHGFREVLAAAAAMGVRVQSIEVRTPDEHPAACAAIVASRADALSVFTNPANIKNLRPIVDFAQANRLPSSFDQRFFVEAGGLFSYGSSFQDTYRRGATYVDKILKGAKPAELPIQQPITFELVVNMKTAKALGLTVPRSLLLQAEIIE